jgi:hypothetical protein
MTTSPNPYAPPGSDVGDRRPAPISSGTLGLRIAGAFLAVHGIMRGIPAVFRFSPRATDLPPLLLLASFAPTVVMTLIDVALAVPLLRGSTRWRVAIWVRAIVAVVWSILLALSGYFAAKRFSPDRAEWMLKRLAWQLPLGVVFALVLFLLVTDRPRPWRIAGGLVGIAIIVAASLL